MSELQHSKNAHHVPLTSCTSHTRNTDSSDSDKNRADARAHHIYRRLIDWQVCATSSRSFSFLVARNKGSQIR